MEVYIRKQPLYQACKAQVLYYYTIYSHGIRMFNECNGFIQFIV
jgi:hypothetical protein